MNYGFNVGASGVLATMFRQDVAANNLANIQTVGFKPDVATTLPRSAAREEDGLFHLPSNTLLERLGAGVLLAPTRTSFSQGAVTRSGNPLDVAIEGDGFLAVSAEDGSTRLTRDGRLTLDKGGRLVTVTDGQPVLDSSGRPITLDPRRSLDIDERGNVSQSGAVVATLQFVDVPNRAALKKVGGNQYQADAATVSTFRPAGGRVLQGNVEQSAADPIRAVMDVQNAASAVGSTVRIMQIHDELMNRAINTLGRVTT
ncbi:MAG: flagellar hook-basal body protein [Phycisphaerales bacterium]|nr:flagellar hook-basal body protein [Phycisphaerales bacterium]